MVVESGGPLAAEHPGAVALQQLVRAVKLVGLHAVDNQLVRQALPQALAALEAACDGQDRFVATFGEDAVWLNGRLLQTSRATYELCSQLGPMLEVLGGNQLVIERGITAEELQELLLAVSGADRSGASPGRSVSRGRVALRRVETRHAGRPAASAPTDSTIYLYTSAVVLTGRFLEEAARGRYDLFRSIKRLAQRFVAQADVAPYVLRQLVIARATRIEEQAQAVHGAILALLAARQLTSDRHLLLQLVTAGLVMDAARPRAANLVGSTMAERARVKALLKGTAGQRVSGASAFLFLTMGQPPLEAASRAVVIAATHGLLSGGGEFESDAPFEAYLLAASRRLVQTVADSAMGDPVTLAEAARRLKSTWPGPQQARCLELIVKGAGLDQRPRVA